MRDQFNFSGDFRGAAIGINSPAANRPGRKTLRVFPEEIGAFSLIAKTKRVMPSEVAALGELAEEEVKRAFATIIGEPFVPKDWGGEKSDLQTNHLTVRGESCAAAFLFKGPGVKGELHPNRLGKRGDQLIRAFDEPVELVVVQYHGKIANSVVSHAEALASDSKRSARYCIIDGADTVRILKTYDQLPAAWRRRG